MKKVQKTTLLASILIIACSLFINCGSEDDSSGSSNTPEITVTGNISSFGPIDAGTNSVAKTVQVAAKNLTANLLIKVTSNFQVSLDGATFSNQVSIAKSTANSEDSMVYVRFSPALNTTGTLTGTVSFESTGATTKTLALNGLIAAIVPTIYITENVSDFGEVTINTNSASQSITITGANLTAPISITTSGAFEVSLNNTNFSSTTEITAANANSENTLYIRFSPTQIGAVTQTLTITSTDAASQNISLSGTGIPITHNYQAFNEQYIAFGGGNNQSASQVFTLHDNLNNIQQIKMYLQIDCPTTGCDEWDRFANVKVKDPDSGNWYEIGRYITPYWVGTERLERGLEFDVTDFKSLLTGTVELRIYIENWTTDADIISVDFDFIEGTPDYPYYAVAEVLNYHNNSIDGVPYGVTHNFDLDKQITIPTNAESTHLRTTISGWGHATPNGAGGRPCAEWCFKTHAILINGGSTFTHELNGIGCAANPINNQNPGNWTPDRAGWCPGMVVPVRIDAFTNNMAGSTFTFAYDFEDWTNDMQNGNAYYATSTYVIVKSNTPITAPIVVN